MMTGSIGRRVVRLAAVLVLAGFSVGCASSQGPGAMTAPAGYGKDPGSRAERLVQYCDRLADQGELVTALGLCARAHEVDPDNPAPLMKVATILQAMNRQQAAAETYGVLLERHPGHLEARYSLSKIYMESGDTALASIHLNRAMTTNPDDPRAYNALGILRDQEGEHEAAQVLYRQALERDPANVSVRNNLGLSLALNGKREEAIDVLAELAVDPGADPTVLRNLEAAYAARTVVPAEMDAEPEAEAAPELTVGPEAEPKAEPAAAAIADPAEPASAEPVSAPAPLRAPQSAPKAPEASTPTPLYVPPAASGKVPPAQSGAREVKPAEQGGSAILAAAEQLLRAPAQAEIVPAAPAAGEPPPAAAPEPSPAEDFGSVEIEGPNHDLLADADAGPGAAPEADSDSFIDQLSLLLLEGADPSV
ncbi:MAG: tetratricopeptide repeat protein [Kiloniellaceae bacterium]